MVGVMSSSGRKISSSGQRVKAALCSKDALYSLFIVLIIMVSGLVYFNRNAVDMEGWEVFYGLQMERGKRMYADFFAYTPPVYTLNCLLRWNLLGGNLVCLRLLGLLDRAVLFVGIYLVLGSWFKKENAFFATIFGFYLFNTLPFNSYSDYTQYAQITALLGVYCASRFARAYLDPALRAKKRDILWLFAAGLFASNSVMCKQSIGIGVLGMFSLALFLFCIVERTGKRTFAYIGTAIASFIVCMLPYVIWLLSTGSLSAAIEQIFLSSLNSKGLSTRGASSTAAIVADAAATGGYTSLGRVLRAMVNKGSLKIWIFTLIPIAAWLFQKKNAGSRAKKPAAICAVVLSAAWGVWLLFTYDLKEIFVAPFQVLWNGRSIGYLQVAMVVLAAALLFYLGRRRDAARRGKGILLPEDGFSVAVLTFLLIFSAVCMSHYQLKQNQQLCSEVGIIAALAGLFELAFHGCNILWLLDILRRLIYRKGFLPVGSWFFIAAADANAIISLIGGGSATYSQNGSLFTVPFVMVVALGLLDRLPTKRLSSRGALVSCRVFLIVFLCAVSSICMARRLITPYSFIGWTSDAVEDRTSYSIDIDRYAGIRTSKRTKNVLEEVPKLIVENTDEDDFVWTFPTMKMFNILSGRMEMPTFVPVYFFDVCPDNYAIADVDILRENMPEMIVWKDLGESEWQSYEKNYRNGNPLGQRQLQKWFNEVKTSQYTQIGSVYNITVYLRNDLPVRYTYTETLADSLSLIDECRENVQKETYLHDLLRRYISDSSQAKIAFWAAIAVMLALGAAAVYASPLPVAGMGAAVCGMYLSTSFSPALLMLLTVPITWMVYHRKRYRGIVGTITFVLYSAIVLLTLFAWSGLWDRLKGFVAVLCAAVLLFHGVYGVWAILSRGGNCAWVRCAVCLLVIPAALALLMGSIYQSPPVEITKLCGIYEDDAAAEEAGFRWCNRNAVWRFTGLDYPQEDAYLELVLGRGDETSSTLSLRFGDTSASVPLEEMQTVRVPVTITDGEHALSLHCEGDPLELPGETRQLFYQLVSISLYDGEGNFIAEAGM